MQARDWHARLARLVVMAALAGGTLGTALGAPPVARAECDGGSAYVATVPLARAAVVGTIASIDKDSLGMAFATAVRVERAYGIRSGGLLRGAFWAGDPCTGAGDDPVVGARVVVLLGVPLPGAHDLFYTIGKTVTPWQADHVESVLPDTATAVGHGQTATLPSPWPLLVAGGIGFVLVLRRVRRGGAPPPRPRPRTRAV